MARLTQFHLELSRPLPNTGGLADMDFDPDIVALRITTGLPGGFETCEVGIDTPSRRRHYGGGWRGYLPVQLDLRPFAHVVVRAGQATLFEGRIMRLERGPDGRYRGFVAVGYGLTALHDDYYTTTSITLDTSGSILEQVLKETAPLIRVDSGAITDPQVEHAYNEYDLLAPAEVVDQVSREGGITNAPLDWAVWEGRRATLSYRLPPDEPDYTFNWGSEVTEWSEDYSGVYGTAAVNYTDAGVEATTTSETTAGFNGRYDINRSRLLAGDEMTLISAPQFRDTWLAQHLEPEIQAALDVAELRTPQGIEIPAHLIRAGQWARVGSDGSLLPIVGTDFDGLTRRATIELGARVVTLARNQVRRFDEVRQHALRKTDPLTGTRRR